MRDYDNVCGRSLQAVKNLHERSEACERVNIMERESFTATVGLRQDCDSLVKAKSGKSDVKYV